MDEQNALESALRALRPAAGGVDAIAAAYAAGRLSGRRQTRVWQTGSLVMTVACGLLLLGRFNAPSPRTPAVTPIVAVRVSAPATLPPSPLAAWSMEEAVLQHGLDGLPRINAPAVARPITADQLY